MKPLSHYFKNLFRFNRLLGSEEDLHGLAKADHLLTQLVEDERIPGLAITVLKEGDVFFQKGYGHADIDQKTRVNPENTLFRVASVSKPIAAVAMAKMVASGTIGLDDSLYKHVPYFPKKQADITLRQLAGHTAGIRGYKGKEYALNKPFSIRDSLEVFQDDDLLFDPGTGYHYNSYDWVLVSLAMEEAGRTSFAEYAKKEVLAPLKLSKTIPEVPGQEHPDIATFYSKGLGGFRKASPVDNRYKLAGGGYLSTASEIAWFGQAVLEEKLGDSEIIKQFLVSQKVDGHPTWYGLGWQVSEDDHGRPFYGHIGNGVGGYSNFFVYPEKQTVFAILINCTDPKVQEDLDQVIDALLVE